MGSCYSRSWLPCLSPSRTEQKSRRGDPVMICEGIFSLVLVC